MTTLEAQQVFKRAFGYTPPFIVRAPGRLELLGNHTDYNLGLVLSVAIDKYLYLACGPRTDARAELASSAFPNRAQFSLSDLKPNPAAPWTNYVKGMLAQLRKRDIHFSGFNAAVHSAIPIGAGLSSSAALLVATALAIRRMYPFSLTRTGVAGAVRRNRKGTLPPLAPHEKLHLARLCQAAENEFVGLQCGILDPISSLFGKAFHALAIDCLHLTVERLPLVGPVVLVVCHSGVKHSLVDGEYNRLRQCCEAAARALGARSLRSVDLKTLRANKQRLSSREYDCAYHVVGEIQRVVFAERALEEDDLVQFGQYMFQSHESSRDFFRNSCPELDLLVDLARAHPGCLGARLTGGGFGGATINLVLQAELESFKRSVVEQYRARTGRSLDPMVCRAADGAQ